MILLLTCSGVSAGGVAPNGKASRYPASVPGGDAPALAAADPIVVNLTGAVAVFINQSNKLRKIDAQGVISPVLSTDPDVDKIQFDPNGNLFVVFATKQTLQNGNSYLLAKILASDSSIGGIDKDLTALVWNTDTVSPNIQFDAAGNIYYLARSAGGNLLLRKYVNETTITDFINSNITIDHWLVRPDGTVVIGGTTVSPFSPWLRKIAPAGSPVTTIADNANIGWILNFPDNKVYAGFPPSMPFEGVYRLPDNLSQMGNTAYKTPYIGFTKQEFTPEYDALALATGLDPIYCKGLTDTAAVYLKSYAATTANKVIGLTGSGNYRTILYLYPTPQVIPLALLDRITLFRESKGDLIVPGFKDGVPKLVQYNLTTKVETVLVQNIEIFHLDVLSNGLILFDGLDFATNKYVIGQYERPSGAPGPGAQYGYKELASFSSKPGEFSVVNQTTSTLSVAIGSPLHGATVSGAVTITANVTATNTVTKVEFYIDDGLLSTSTTSPYSAGWNTTTAANAQHTIKAKVYDSAAQTAQDVISVVVNNLVATKYTLTIAAGTGGTTDPAPGNQLYDSGKEASVLAISNIGYTFSGWTGDAPSGKENDNPLKITMTANKSLTAAFTIFKIDLSGALVVFVDQNKKLRKINSLGIVTKVINTDPDVDQAQLDPNGKLYVVFSTKQPVGAAPPAGPARSAAVTSFILVKIDPKTNSVTGIDGSLASLVWNVDTVSPNIQFDGAGVLYYLAKKTDGKTALRRYAGESSITDLINDNIRVKHWLVRSDGTVVIAGTTISNGISWLRKVSPAGVVSSIAEGADVGWLLGFPDGRVYAGLPPSAPYEGVYKLGPTLGQIDNTAASTPYIGFISKGFTPAYDVAQLATGVNAAYAKGFTDTAGVYLKGYSRTKTDKIIGLTGWGNYRTVIYYYPTPEIIKLKLVNRISLVKESLGDLFISGSGTAPLTGDLKNKLIWYSLTNKSETDILFQNIEIYHLDVLANGSLIFDGLDFDKNKYVAGMFERAGGSSAGARVQYGYKELAALSGKPGDFLVVEDSTETKPGVIKASPSQLAFGATIGGVKTASQIVRISNTGQGTLNWSASSDSAWLSCTPAGGAGSGIITISVDPTGLPVGGYTGKITVSSADASNSPQTVTVTLTVKNTTGVGGSQPPFGEFSTPVDGTTGVTGAIPVTGWVADDIEVTRVEVKRDIHALDPREAVGPDGLVYIGDAIFVEGARPDIELGYPGYPMNSKAGWGYMLLTNFLPAQGNGIYKLHAYAYDREGYQTYLGTKTITCANASATKPFGTIDTPAQGGDASGSLFVNFGWVLTPLPKTVPKDGSTIQVYVDGTLIGDLKTAPNVYDQYRVDVATAFPGLNNSSGPVGAFYLNTSGYTNGVHTIYWIATDDAGAADGIGSRYFTITNIAGAPAAGAELMTGVELGLEGPVTLDRLMELPVSFEPLEVRTGFDLKAAPSAITPDRFGAIRIVISEVGRVEIDLKSFLGLRRTDARGLTFAGYQVVGKELRKLPIGSNLDEKTGIFTWSPGPGYLGQYQLLFVVKNAAGVVKRIPVTVWIRAKR